MTCCNGNLIADSLYPVGSFVRTIHIRVVEVFAHNALPIPATFATVETHLIHYFHILLGCQHLWHAIYVSPTYVGIVRYLNFALLTLLGSYQNNTIGSSRTIDSTRCRIFQYVNTLNVGRVQVIDITSHTIYDIKRSCITVGTSTTDRDLKTITRLTRSSLNINTRSLTLQSSEHLCGIHLLNIVTLHLDGRTCNEFLFLNTITYNNDLVEGLVVCLQGNIDVGLCSNFDFLCLVTDIGNHNGCTWFHIKREVTIQVGNSSIRRITLLHNTCADNWTF